MFSPQPIDHELQLRQAVAKDDLNTVKTLCGGGVDRNAAGGKSGMSHPNVTVKIFGFN